MSFCFVGTSIPPLHTWMNVHVFHLRKRFHFSPALLSLKEFTVSSDLNVQSHLHIQEVLILPKVASHLLLQMTDLLLQLSYVVLVVGNLNSKLVFHVTHLPQQCIILEIEGSKVKTCSPVLQVATRNVVFF